MGSTRTISKHPEDVLALVMMKIVQTHALKQIPSEPDLAFCFTMLQRVSRSFAFVIQQLGPDLRNVVCIFYLIQATIANNGELGFNEVGFPQLEARDTWATCEPTLQT